MTVTSASADISLVLDEATWRARERAHAERVDAWTASHLDRRRRGERHPVWDFLWTYYSYRPAQLRRWHPGPGVTLVGASERSAWRGYRTTSRGVAVDIVGLGEQRLATIAWVRELLHRTASRPAHLGCFGMHEWAMVYRQRPTDLRHARWPLRLGAERTDAVVEAHPVRCSHFDAFRFFTPDAASRNQLQPTREDQLALEQPGCLHATMDLYKWAYKLDPLTPSDLIGDSFELARDVRELDMRASPYDLSALGLEPVRIETHEGKAEYVAAQRSFVERAATLRQPLLDVCNAALLT